MYSHNFESSTINFTVAVPSRDFY